MAKAQKSTPTAILSALLRELRENVGMTQAELASRLKVTQSFVSKYESGERRLDFVEVSEISHALDSNIEKISAKFADRTSGQS